MKIAKTNSKKNLTLFFRTLTKKNKVIVMNLLKICLLAFPLSLFFSFSLTSQNVLALNNITGENIFSQHCAGCHLMGKNIIRRSKNLKLKTLQRNGLDNPESIAQIAREGIGRMDGYAKVLKEGEDKVVAIWILNQAQNAWTQG